MLEAPSEPKDWAGEFRIKPGDEALRRGVLRYHPTEGIRLLISDHSARPGAHNHEDYPVISGIIEGQRPVSLLHCFDSSVEFNFSGYEKRNIFVNAALFGLPDVDLRKPTFSKLGFRSPNVTQWLGSRGLRIDDGPRRLDTVIRWRPPKNFKVKLDELRTLEFFCGYTRSSGLVNGKVQFEVQPRFSLGYARRQAWEAVHRDMASLDLFFCFATRSWRGPPQIGIQSAHSRRCLPDPEDGSGRKGRPYHEPHEVLISQSWYRTDLNEENRRTRPLFSFEEARPKLDVILARWFERRRVVERAIALLRASQNSDVGLETSFLLLAQAAEFVHRETIGGTLIGDDNFAELKDALIAAIPQKLSREARNVIAQRLEYLNEPGLRRRLKELFRAVRNPPKFVDDYKAVSGSIADYRNAFTHHLSLSQSADIWVQDLSRLSDVLTGLLELYLCRLLGFGDAETDRMMEQDWELQRRFRS